MVLRVKCSELRVKRCLSENFRAPAREEIYFPEYVLDKELLLLAVSNDAKDSYLSAHVRGGKHITEKPDGV